MKQLVKISNSELSYRLNLNYNNVYSRLKMLLGKNSSLFADISTKSTGTTWYSDDDAEYSRLSEAPKAEQANISKVLTDKVNSIRKELMASQELENYVDDILEIPDQSFVFYRPIADGYKVILAGWGCKYAHQGTTDSSGGFIKRLSKPLDVPDSPVESPVKKDISQMLAGIHNDEQRKESQKQELKDVPKEPDKGSENIIPSTRITDESDMIVKSEEEKKEPEPFVKKTQHVNVRVIDQNSNPVDGEVVQINSSNGLSTKVTSDKGLVDVGNLPYSETFGVSFPNVTGNQERTFEVEPGVETYDAFLKKLVKYTPILFIEDQNGNAVQDYNVKVVIKGQDTVYNSGTDGVIQLPTMQEGQKFVVIDTANYANTEEYNITQAEAKTPYHFHIKTVEKSKVGITVLDKSGKPIPNASVNLQIGDTPCCQQTGNDGRAEFPNEVFVEGDIPVILNIKGKGHIKSNLRFTSDVIEYTIQLRDGKKPSPFNWKWLSLIPLLLLCGWGGYKLYNLQWSTPTWEELQKGVVLIKSEEIYSMSTGLSEETGYATLYFGYDPNEHKIMNATFDAEKAKGQISSGTGFFISKDGMIATNRHVADPIPPKEQVIALVKSFFVDAQEFFETKARQMQNLQNKYSTLRYTDPKYAKALDEIQDSLDYYSKGARYYDRILKLCTYDVKSHCNCFAAFDNSMIKTIDDQAFHPCSRIISGDPGDVESNDLSVIQLNEKEKIMPKDAYIFSIPDSDPFEDNKEANEDYEIWVLGYSKGLLHSGYETGIHPQHSKGNVSSTNNKYHIEFNAGNEGGSSGGPVLNKKRELVAINNSGFANTQIRFGVRTKYLKELVEKIKNDRNVTK